MAGLLKSILFAINAVCLVLLCLYVAVHIPSFGMWFYGWQFGVNDTEAVIGASREELMRVTHHMLDYLRGHEPYLQVVAVVGGEPRDFFNQREILHMVDVYDLFVAGRLLRNLAASVFVSTMAVLFIMRLPLLEGLARAYRAMCVVMLVAVVGLAVPFVIDFHHAFIVFHEIFFDNDLWQLNPETDLLINLVPLNFFITIGVVIAGIFLGLLLVIGALSHWYLRMLPPPLKGPKFK